MPAGCPASAILDIPSRWRLPQYPATWTPTSLSRERWGPDLDTYAAVTASQVKEGGQGETCGGCSPWQHILGLCMACSPSHTGSVRH